MWRPDRRILVSVADTDALAQFLRARRELVHPADVGLPEDGRRRVVGLRREEVAMLQLIARPADGGARGGSEALLGRRLRFDTFGEIYWRSRRIPKVRSGS